MFYCYFIAWTVSLSYKITRSSLDECLCICATILIPVISRSSRSTCKSISERSPSIAISSSSFNLLSTSSILLMTWLGCSLILIACWLAWFAAYGLIITSKVFLTFSYFGCSFFSTERIWDCETGLIFPISYIWSPKILLFIGLIKLSFKLNNASLLWPSVKWYWISCYWPGSSRKLTGNFCPVVMLSRIGWQGHARMC